MERENLAGDAKGKDRSGYNRKVESTDARERGAEVPIYIGLSAILPDSQRPPAGELPEAAG
jgi:hypothetical protein